MNEPTASAGPQPPPQTKIDASVKLTYGKPPLPQHLQIAAIHQSHVGPLPPVETLAGYDEVRPGTADDIVGMAIRGHDAEIRRADKALDYTFRLELWGRLLSAGFAGAIALGGIALIFCGHDTSGATVVTAAVTGVAVALIKGRAAKGKS